MSISFARGVPAPECLAVDELADCARTALERDGTADPPLRAGRRLRPAARVDRGAPRRRAGPRPAHERLAPGLRLPRRAARPPRHARARRGADLRPAAEDPRPARRRDRAARDGRGRARSGRARAGARRAQRTGVPLHDRRPSRTRAAGRCPRSAAAASSRSPASPEPARARGRPVRPHPLRGQPRRRSSSTSTAATTSPMRRRSRRRSRRASASATSCCRPTLAAQIEAIAVSTYISPPFLTAGDRPRVPPPRRFEPNLARVTGLLQARAATRCSRRSRGICPQDATSRARRAATSSGPTLPSGPDTADLLPPRGGGGRHVRQGRRLLRAARREGRAARCGSPSASSRPRRSPRASRGSRRSLRAGVVVAPSRIRVTDASATSRARSATARCTKTK